MRQQEIALLDELRLTVVIDNETDTLSSIDPGVPQIGEIGGFLQRFPPAREFDRHSGKTFFDRSCCACHGLSVLATGRLRDRQHSLLFDVGPYASVWTENAARLGIDVSAIEGAFLSHWHFDHSGGFPEVVAAIAGARQNRGLPLRSSMCTRIGQTSAESCCHPGRWSCCRRSRASINSRLPAGT